MTPVVPAPMKPSSSVPVITEPKLPVRDLPSSSSNAVISTSVRAESPPTAAGAPGVFGWVRGTGFLSKVVEKTKSVTENVITTLDPQMKEFIHSGGSVEVIVASDKDDKVTPVREAFQQVFGKATVYGLPSKSISIAEQPVGFASGKQAALERISTLRKSGAVGASSCVVSVENLLYEVSEELWVDISCLILSDPGHKANLQTFSQPTPLEAKYVELLKKATPDNYPRQWSGFGVPIGQVMAAELNVPHTSWQEAVTGIHKKELIHSAARALAGMYRRHLQSIIQDI